MAESSPTQWSSPFKSWHDRALLTPHPDPHSFAPTQENLLLAMFLNAQAEGDGISLAPFSQAGSDNAIAVDARGRVIVVSAKDVAGLLALAKEAQALPKEFYRAGNPRFPPDHRLRLLEAKQGASHSGGEKDAGSR